MKKKNFHVNICVFIVQIHNDNNNLIPSFIIEQRFPKMLLPQISNNESCLQVQKK